MAGVVTHLALGFSCLIPSFLIYRRAAQEVISQSDDSGRTTDVEQGVCSLSVHVIGPAPCRGDLLLPPEGGGGGGGGGGTPCPVGGGGGGTVAAYPRYSISCVHYIHSQGVRCGELTLRVWVARGRDRAARTGNMISVVDLLRMNSEIGGMVHTS